MAAIAEFDQASRPVSRVTQRRLSHSVEQWLQQTQHPRTAQRAMAESPPPQISSAPNRPPRAVPDYAIGTMQPGGECTFHAVARPMLRLWGAIPRQKTPSYNTLIAMMRATCTDSPRNSPRNYMGNIGGLINYIGDPESRALDTGFQAKLAAAQIDASQLESYYEFPTLECSIDHNVTQEHNFIFEFFLSEGQWENFRAFFQRNPRGVLTEALINKELPPDDRFIPGDGGHAVVVDNPNCTSELVTVTDSRGPDFGDGGKFKIASFDVLQIKHLTDTKPPKLYCVNYHGGSTMDDRIRNMASPSATPHAMKKIPFEHLGMGSQVRLAILNGKVVQKCRLLNDNNEWQKVLVKRISQASARELHFAPQDEHIATVYGYCEDFESTRPLDQPGNRSTPTAYIIVMEAGGTALAELKKKNNLSLDERLEVLRQTACAVESLASFYITHGDIGPQTIFRFGNTWKLMDFGCAEEVGNPESWTEPIAVDLGVSRRQFTRDVWSLGELIKYLDLECELLPGLVDLAQNPANRCTAAHIRQQVELRQAADRTVFDRWRNAGLSIGHVAIDAAYAGMTEVVRLLVQHPSVDLSLVDAEGMSALMAAADRGHDEIVRILCTSTQTHGQRQFALSVALLEGRSQCIEPLLQEGVDFSMDLLKLAFTLEHDGVIEALLSNVSYEIHADGAVDATLVDQHDNQFIMLSRACVRGKSDWTEALLRLGARTGTVPGDGHLPPLLLAAAGGHEGCVSALLNHHDVDIEVQDDEKQTALWHAANGGFINCVDLLLRNGAKVDAANHKEWTALHVAAAQGHTGVIELLLRFGANINYLANGGCTPFMIAAFNGRANAMMLLFRNGCKADEKDAQGLTALHHAVINGECECVRLMLAVENLDRLDPDMTDHFGRNSVCLAAIHGQLHCLKLLLLRDNPIAVRCKDRNNRSALAWTALHGHEDCLEELLTWSADAVDVEEGGRTPLMLAAMHGHHGCMVKLITHLIASRVA